MKKRSAEQQTAPVIPTEQNAAEQRLKNTLNSGTISSKELDPLPQNNVVNILRSESKDWINQLTQDEIRTAGTTPLERLSVCYHATQVIPMKLETALRRYSLMSCTLLCTRLQRKYM